MLAGVRYAMSTRQATSRPGIIRKGLVSEAPCREPYVVAASPVMWMAVASSCCLP